MSTDEETSSPPPSNKRPADEPAESAKLKQSKYLEQRKALGSSFGTRKAQKIQATRDSNIIDTSNLTGVMDSLVSLINAGAQTVPTQELIQAKQEELRPVPKYDLAAETPSEIYKLDDVITSSDKEATRSIVSAMKNSDAAGCVSQLAHRRSTYLNQHIHRIMDVKEGEKVDSKSLRIIYFASVLIGLYNNRRSCDNREKLTQRLNNCPSTLLDSLLTRFTNRGVMDNRNADRLLNHFLVLSLHLDNFAVDMKQVQEDLQLRPPQIAQLYKELGCTVSPLTESQRLARNLTKHEAKSLKRAVLKVPLTFPPPKRGGPKR